MPELPEVETVRHGLESHIRGHTVTSVDIHLPRLVRSNIRALKANLPGQKCKAVYRQGKVLFICFENSFLAVHLKMTGKFLWTQKSSPVEKHTHAIFGVENDYQLRYNDIRKFGYFIYSEESLDNLITQINLGPDVLSIPFQTFHRILRGRKARLKSVLLDQSVVAGLGNIYTDEALFAARLHPLQPAHTISTYKYRKLHGAIQEILNKAIACGGSSVSNYRDIRGLQGGYQDHHQVYRKTGQPCPNCGQPIKRIAIGRTTHYCPHCQKLRIAKTN